MAIQPDRIADSVFATFERLPQKYKPRQLEDGRQEWVPIAGIILSKSRKRDLEPTRRGDSLSNPADATPLKFEHECVALATGMKCLPRNKIELVKGNVLHDSHAEILAIRAFNRFLIDECADLAAGTLGEESSRWVEWRVSGEDSQEHFPSTNEAGDREQPFSLKEDVSIHMYCSEAPCGDASMELVMAQQECDAPWEQAINGDTTGAMQGRGHFDQLGVVRRKPSRADAPPSWSKSCSDKLAMKQCTGLLSAMTSRLVWPGNAYISTMVLPESQHVPKAIERAFSSFGRMAPLAKESVQEHWRRDGYAYKPFRVETTSREFAYSKRSLVAINKHAPIASNRSAVYTLHKQEVLINGVLEGRRWKDTKALSSCVSRRGLWKAIFDVATLASLPGLRIVLNQTSYGEMKASEELKGRQRVKDDVRKLALEGWMRNTGDEGWTLSLGEQA